MTFPDEGEPHRLRAVALREAFLAGDPAGQGLIPVDAERL